MSAGDSESKTSAANSASSDRTCSFTPSATTEKRRPMFWSARKESIPAESSLLFACTASEIRPNHRTVTRWTESGCDSPVPASSGACGGNCNPRFMIASANANRAGSVREAISLASDISSSSDLDEYSVRSLPISSISAICVPQVEISLLSMPRCQEHSPTLHT